MFFVMIDSNFDRTPAHHIKELCLSTVEPSSVIHPHAHPRILGPRATTLISRPFTRKSNSKIIITYLLSEVSKSTESSITSTSGKHTHTDKRTITKLETQHKIHH
jgi:hypothetical protein